MIRYILPGTKIISDGWRAYRNIENLGGGIYDHEVIIHEQNFVDPNDGNIHTQSIENVWMRAKRKLKRQFGTSRDLFPSYIHEFIWRNKFARQNTFMSFLVCLTQQYEVG
jgi:transposase-like protein